MSVVWTVLDSAAWTTIARLGIDSYHACLDARAGVVVSESWTRQTRRIEVAAGPDRGEFYLKVFRFEGPRWRHRFRRDAATVEARNYALLREVCGLPTADVIAYGARRSRLRLLDAVLITRGIERTAPLDAFQPAPDERRTLAALTAAAVARMHAHRFFHSDLEWRNILVRRGPAGIEAYIIDSSRGDRRRCWLLRRHGRIRDLASLDRLARRRLTRTQRLRWLLAYLDSRRLDGAQRRLVWSVLRYSRRKFAGD